MVLGVEDRDRLGDIVDASLQVNGRAQFFLWAQGIVQCLVPHEVLICGMAQGAGFGQERFTLLPASVEADPALVARALAQWEPMGKPLVLHEQGAVLHAVRGADARVSGWFCFAGLRVPSNARLCYLVEILVPYVYCTYARVLVHESRRPAAPRVAPEVTRRETEILRWIQEGKTNADIADILGLSPWTVKNHVQNMLKKLGVQNRAQAVSRAISTRLIRS
jgi:DNA-binding CsgD family transcriptional regulator